MGEVLDRIRSKVGEINSTNSDPTRDNTDMLHLSRDKAEGEQNTEPSSTRTPTAENEATPSFPAQLLGKNELSNYKARIIAAARATEAKARETEEKCLHLEAQLDIEIEHRRTAEKRLRGIEGFYNKQATTLEYEELKRITLEETLVEVETSLIREAESRAEAEKKRDEALAQAAEAIQRLRTMEEKSSETEAITRAVEKSVQQLQARAIAAEESARQAKFIAHSAEKTVGEIKALIYESERIANEAQEKCRSLELRLAQETEMRLFAEQQLKALLDELNIDLEVDRVKLESDLPQTTKDIQHNSINEDLSHQLQSQLETERNARLEAELAREESEKIAREARDALASLEKKQTNAVAYYEYLLKHRPQEQAKKQLPQRAGVAESINRRNNRLKLMAFGSATVLLIIILILLGIAAYNQL